ncbi:multidrug efflux pump RND permease subunit MdtC [Rhodovastum atsumiense]|nr:efflux RND transporter permease subunit [Rhodovastum atsumiense]CAH2600007.1 multidrug efflux pump RND permease subunit MdtC [Rhodovastum atsumiense]
MSFSTPFILRPVATVLLAIGILLAGAVAYRFLPVAALPSVDIPTVVVFASRPGADPETMATSIAAPLERRLGEIAGVTELTSTSAVGSTSIVVQFDLSRDIDGAAHDVQAAINAATPDLPSDLPTRPYFRKFNPAEMPVITLALTSDTLSPAQVYDAADSVLAQRLSQVEGVAAVQVNGAEKPAVRVRLNPAALAAAGLSAQDVTTAIRAANVNGPLGGFQGPDRAETIGLNNQLMKAADYRGLVLKSSNGATLRLSDVASVIDGVANTRLAAWFGRHPAILLNVTKTAGANVIETVDRVKAVLPLLQSWMPPDIHLTILSDRTQSIRASVDDVQLTLLMSVGLVLMVVALFMRRLVPTIAAMVTVPLSIAGTLAAMWLYGFSLNNFSLMALTVATGFVVDDAIVMIENIVRHMERGTPPLQAAIVGARQIGFTVVSISLSLVAVFIPVLFMGGILGRLFHEFATTLTLAIAISAVVSLTLTPMLCGQFMRPDQPGTAAAPRRASLWTRLDALLDRGFRRLQHGYADSLAWALRWRWLMLLATFATIGLTIWLYTAVPKGFLPTQDTGLLQGSTLAGPEISFAAMTERQRAVVEVLLADPAIEAVGSTIGVSSGWGSQNRGQLTIALKPYAQRGVTADQVIARLRPQLARVGAMQTFLWAAQDMRGGGRQGADNQFVLLGPDLAEVRQWSERLTARLRVTPGITDVSSDQDRAGPQANLVIDREAAARLGVSVNAIDAALDNAFAQRQVSIIYTARNQYRVVVEVDPRLQDDPTDLFHLFVPGRNGTQVPIGAVTRLERGSAPLAVRHQGQFPAATISYGTAPGTAEGSAAAAVQQAALDLRMPDTLRTDFAGNARWLAQSLSSQPYLIGAAFLAIYIVLGVLYESLTQPITIISTLPSAGLGALLAMLVTNTPLGIMGIIGILLLMGIVKKNAIMMIDFALEQERQHGLSPQQAIHAACLERFRPIMMTTLAALLSAVPLALGFGTGGELRQPLGIAVIGGLIVSQALTLYTTPIISLALQRRRSKAVPAPAE